MSRRLPMRAAVLAAVVACGDGSERELVLEASPIDPAIGNLEVTAVLNTPSHVDSLSTSDAFTYACQPVSYCAQVTRQDLDDTRIDWDVLDAGGASVWSVSHGFSAGSPEALMDCVELALPQPGSYTVRATATDPFAVRTTYMAAHQCLATIGILPHCFEGDDPRQALVVGAMDLEPGAIDAATGLGVAGLAAMGGEAVFVPAEGDVAAGFELHLGSESLGAGLRSVLGMELVLAAPGDPTVVLGGAARELAVLGAERDEPALVLRFRPTGIDTYALEPVATSLEEVDSNTPTGVRWRLDEGYVTAVRLGAAVTIAFEAGAWERLDGATHRTSTAAAAVVVATDTTWFVGNACGNAIPVDAACALRAFGTTAPACAALCL